MSKALRARILHELGSECLHAGDYVHADSLLRHAAELDPAEPTYLFDFSINCDRLQRRMDAFDAVKRYVELPGGLDDPIRLMWAIAMFGNCGSVADLEMAMIIPERRNRPQATAPRGEGACPPRNG